MDKLMFLGREIELSEEFLYDPHRDYWVSVEELGRCLTFGLTPAGVLKEGGYHSIEFTVPVGEEVQTGDTIAVAVTGKIKYLEAPAAGRVLEVNRLLEQSAAVIAEAPYTCWWLVRQEITGENDLACLVSAAEYRTVLAEADGRAAHGVKGVGSPTCRSVYEGLRAQKEKGVGV